MNNIIKAIFNNFTVDGVLIPVKFLRYEGHGQPYVIYSLESNGEPLNAEDNIANYVEYYDFTIYSKGNYLKIEERLKDLLIERLEHSLEIIKKHPVKKIVLTGGVGVKGNYNESEFMLNYLIANGVEKNKIIVENKSTTTEENNENIMKMLELNHAQNPVQIVLVSQELHLFRIKLHWTKLLKNENVHFYYDYVENSSISYENVIKDPYLLEIIKEQVVKTQYFINIGKYDDRDV